MDPNHFIFDRGTLAAAKAVVCGYYHGHSVQERFDVETKAQMRALNPFIKKAATILDYGIGVGRMTKAILDVFPGVKVIGVDNSEKMLEHAREYVPERHFSDGRVELIHASDFGKVKDKSIDFALGIYVFMHISSDFIGQALDGIDRTLKDEGLLYVMNQTGRSVPQMSNMQIYGLIRSATRFLERFADKKQVQRLIAKIDNRTINHHDCIDVSQVLAQRFVPLEDIPLSGHHLIDRIMKRHFSRIYAKK
jgi:ubiquinone/menaquinone biosynthesis C-methylase UbiE